MQNIGCPLVGDLKYNKNAKPNECFLGLWAYEIKLNHPITDEKLTFRVYPDTDIYPWNKCDLDRFLSVNIKNLY